MTQETRTKWFIKSRQQDERDIRCIHDTATTLMKVNELLYCLVDMKLDGSEEAKKYAEDAYIHMKEVKNSLIDRLAEYVN